MDKELQERCRLGRVKCIASSSEKWASEPFEPQNEGTSILERNESAHFVTHQSAGPTGPSRSCSDMHCEVDHNFFVIFQ